MSKYRFKTQEEFIRDGQWDDDNHCPEGWSQSGEMNHYLGEDVPEGANESCDLHEGFDVDGWWFESTNYVLKESSDITFYVQYCTEFTEGVYNALMEWCKTNSKANPRGLEDNYAGLIRNKYFAVSSVYYGVDNNSQIFLTKQEYTIDQIKSLIGYTVSEVKPIVSEDYTGRWIKALVNDPGSTSVKLGEVIQIISKPGGYRLDKTSKGYSGMGIQCPLDTSKWELVEQPKDIVKPSSFPSSGAILISECDNLKEFKRYLFNSGRTCNEAVGNPKYLSWNGTSFWYPTTGTGKTIYQWNQLKHFVPTSKVVPGYVRCVQALMNAKAGKIYPVVDEKHCLC
jgi:hypothetical protein